MATNNKEEEPVVEDVTLTDWLLDMPMRIFFWGGVLITFALWILAVGLVFIFTRR